MGTAAWRNWRAYADGEPELENVDDELYSDRHFSGGAPDLGPYSLQPVHGTGPGGPSTTRPAIRLRISIHARLVPDVVVAGKLAKADSSSYHGGTIGDEVAALASLALGVRLRDAGTSRLSGLHGDSGAHAPIYLEVPPLAHPGRLEREHVPAALTRTADLEQLSRLESFPLLAEKSQVELVRAARAYATGLWWANEDQNQAWLHLVTAVEVAATLRQTDSVAPEELVEQFWPELWEDLSAADSDVRHAVCSRIAGQIRSARKFRDFLVECAPPPPTPRPAYDGLDWDQMASHAGVIYRHRSNALHAGKPFPLPMLQSPRVEEGGAIEEVSPGQNTGALDAVWDAKDYPMLLATFEHITRGALLNWWYECAAAAGATP